MVFFDNSATWFEKFVEHKSTCERRFQKRKRRFLPGIEPASSVVDDPNPLPPDRQGWLAHVLPIDFTLISIASIICLLCSTNFVYQFFALFCQCVSDLLIKLLHFGCTQVYLNRRGFPFSTVWEFFVYNVMRIVLTSFFVRATTIFSIWIIFLPILLSKWNHVRFLETLINSIFFVSGHSDTPGGGMEPIQQ
jgi:hypothetical protein